MKFSPEDFEMLAVVRPDNGEGDYVALPAGIRIGIADRANALLAGDRVMQIAMGVKMENAILQRELSRALATLELIESADRARGYPSGKEWTEVIKTIRETIAVIKTSECLPKPASKKEIKSEVLRGTEDRTPLNDTGFGWEW